MRHNIAAKDTARRAQSRLKALEKNEDWMIKTRSCPFLTDKGCSIYEYRPETCREYPYTHKDEITSRLINLVQNCEICPVVFEIFEKLKKIYRRDFEKYKKEMAVFWK